jgi:hypothetical protein
MVQLLPSSDRWGTLGSQLGEAVGQGVSAQWQRRKEQAEINQALQIYNQYRNKVNAVQQAGQDDQDLAYYDQLANGLNELKKSWRVNEENGTLDDGLKKQIAVEAANYRNLAAANGFTLGDAQETAADFAKESEAVRQNRLEGIAAGLRQAGYDTAAFHSAPPADFNASMGRMSRLLSAAKKQVDPEQAQLALRQQLLTGNFSPAVLQKVAPLMQEYVNRLKEDKEKERQQEENLALLRDMAAAGKDYRKQGLALIKYLAQSGQGKELGGVYGKMIPDFGTQTLDNGGYNTLLLYDKKGGIQGNGAAVNYEKTTNPDTLVNNQTKINLANLQSHSALALQQLKNEHAERLAQIQATLNHANGSQFARAYHQYWADLEKAFTDYPENGEGRLRYLDSLYSQWGPWAKQSKQAGFPVDIDNDVNFIAENTYLNKK